MADRKSDDDDRLGYCRPPKWAQFQKGQSGNPKGRPRKERCQVDELGAADTILNRELARKVKVREGGKSQTRTLLEITQLAQLKSAASGNVVAQREVLRTAREIERRCAERQHALEARRREEFEFVIRLKAAQARIWSMVRAGEEPSRPWPHPDDILIDDFSREWSIRGPVGKAEVPIFRYYAVQRDACFLRAMIELKQRKAGDYERLSVWEPIWMMWDMLLPLRWQVRLRQDQYELSAFDTPLRDLRGKLARVEADTEMLSRSIRMPRISRETNLVVNSLLRPMLNRLGYRSLAHLEAARSKTSSE